MTCKDCIHYDVCERFSDIGSPTVFPNGCSFIKDKSRFIELPCKVGDTVYVVSQGGGFNIAFGVWDAPITDIHIDQFNKISFRVDRKDNNHFGYFELDRVFLEEEAAEKEREKIIENLIACGIDAH